MKGFSKKLDHSRNNQLQTQWNINSSIFTKDIYKTYRSRHPNLNFFRSARPNLKIQCSHFIWNESYLPICLYDIRGDAFTYKQIKKYIHEINQTHFCKHADFQFPTWKKMPRKFLVVAEEVISISTNKNVAERNQSELILLHFLRELDLTNVFSRRANLFVEQTYCIVRKLHFIYISSKPNPSQHTKQKKVSLSHFETSCNPFHLEDNLIAQK